MSLSPSSIATATVNPWLRVLGALEKKISRHSYDTWLKPTRFSHVAGQVIYVQIPTPEFRHISEKFGDLIQEALETLIPEFREVKFMAAEEDPNVAEIRPNRGFAPASVSS